MVWRLVPTTGVLWLMVSITLTTGLSIAIARALAVLWTRRKDSHDLVFADLMIWGWIRRTLLERKIRNARRTLGHAYDGRDRALTRDERVRTLERLATLLGARDAATLGHARRVARHAENIAKEMHLPNALVVKVRLAASPMTLES